MKLVKQYKGELTIKVEIETLEDGDSVMEKLLDLFARVNTQELGVTWDDCDWDLKETCLTCNESGRVYGSDVNGGTILLECPDCGDDNE